MKVETYDMLAVVRTMQINLDRMYEDLKNEGSKPEELVSFTQAIAKMNFVMAEINNARGDA